MPERPSHTFEVEGHSFVVRNYITGGENWELQNIYIDGMKEKGDTKELARTAERKGFELAIVSMDGSSENIVDRIYNLPLDFFRELQKHLVPIVDGKKK